MQDKVMYLKKVCLVAGGIIVLLLLLCYWPHEFAVLEPKHENYLVCKIEKSTDVNAIIVDEITGEWKESIWVENIGEYYKSYPYGFAHADNTFYFYGHFTQDVNPEGYRIFHLENWNVKYPVKHNAIFYVPFKWFVCNLDMLI